MHYFDNAATTFPKPEAVYEQMNEFYRTCGVNVGRGQFHEASVASHMIDETRKMMLNLFHAPQQYQCIFCASATEAINEIIQGYHWEKNMNVYISPFEHNAVLRTLHYVALKYKINVIEIKPDRQSFEYDFNKIMRAFEKDKPEMVVLTHASNAFGFVNPILDVFALAKKYGATTVCDMAQTAGLVDTDIVKANIDFAVFAGHKTLYGPFGIAGFITAKGNMLSPLLYGGTGVDSKNLEMPDSIPLRFEAGSPNIVAISGLNASLKWINEVGIQALFETEKKNTEHLLQILKKHQNIEIVRCPDESKNIGVISCVFNGYSSDSIGQVLSEHDFAVRAGLHCAPKAHEFMGTAPDGTVRFSVGYFTQKTELDLLENILAFIEENS